MTVLTLRIDDELDAQLTRLAEATQRSKSDLVRSFIRRQIALATFERARAELVPLAEQAGWLTDEDVFRDLS
jgi:predicted transcriptional regulator